jgi:hypothetical protein
VEVAQLKVATAATAFARLCYEERLVLMADEVYQSNVYKEAQPFLSFKKVLKVVDLLLRFRVEVAQLKVATAATAFARLTLRDRVEVIKLCYEERLVLMADEVYQSNVYKEAQPFLSFKKDDGAVVPGLVEVGVQVLDVEPPVVGFRQEIRYGAISCRKPTTGGSTSRTCTPTSTRPGTTAPSSRRWSLRTFLNERNGWASL